MNSYNLTQLRLIAFRCGLATSGTKPILYSRILHELTRTPTDLSEPKRILSIDMGIRNMAYCTLHLDPHHPTPLVHAWKNLAMSMTPVISPLIPRSILLEDQTHPEKRGEDPEEKDELKDDDDDDPLLQPQIPQVKEVFDPASMSKTAYTLLRNSLLTNEPTHIIIERQRFRSNGAKHIFEWTLRVNMLEAILHAVLYTLQAEGVWKGSISVVSPSRVGPFWLLDHSQGSRLPDSPRSKFKEKKVELVRNWLENGTTIMDLGKGDVEDVAKRYLVKPPRRSRKSLGMGKKSGNNTTPRKTKLDDLTDCLLQGLAWIEWEKNKSIASRCGLDAILNP
ncbi:putative ribonuclease h-like protein [Golovinomyces cichoracearum]|uniref:Putative ribonuclease h-like protein n=1 Tax=Golovinomyces cichoracearum TaxID=62708 RepID=A0A420INC3_9PEZI|nr:putative ribonuclease h-like protein [Golovinomyces cichoracearum]